MNTFAVPEGVKIGNDILYPELEKVARGARRVMLIVDKTVDALYGAEVYSFLEKHACEVKREFVSAGSLREALLMAYYIVNKDFDIVIAMGGGKVLDVGKYASSMAKKTFVSVPTAISHDGVASPIAVLKCDHGAVRSLECKIPEHIIMDISIIKKAPRQLLCAGLGDLVSNITALRDWQKSVAHGTCGMDDFAYIISGTAVRAILQYENAGFEDDRFLTQLAESVVLSGLAMNITGNTRPSSGAEHLISHGIDAIGKGTFHGVQAGVACILIEYLYGGDWQFIREFMKKFGLPTTFEELGLTFEDFCQAVRLAPETRKGRYTILNEIPMDTEYLREIYTTVYGGKTENA